MKFSIDAVELQRILHLLQVPAVVNTKDATGRVLIKANADGTCLFLCRNHLKEIYLTIETDKVIVDEEGVTSVVYVELKSFASPIRPWDGEIGAKDFCFQSKGNDIFVTTSTVHENGKKTNARLKLSKYEIYDIKQPTPFHEATFTLTSEMYRKALNRISYAIESDEAGENIMGANVIFGEEKIYFAGTNGVKVAELSLENVSGLKNSSIRFKYEFIQGLKRLIVPGQKLEFEESGKEVKVRFDGAVFGSQLIIGREYANYRGQFDRFEDTVRLDKEILLESIRPIVDLLNPEDYYRTTLSLNGDGLVIYCDMARFTYSGDVAFKKKFEVDFNGRFFFDTINAIDDDTILFKYSEPLAPLVFDSGSFEDQKAILVPLSRR